MIGIFNFENSFELGSKAPQASMLTIVQISLESCASSSAYYTIVAKRRLVTRFEQKAQTDRGHEII